MWAIKVLNGSQAGKIIQLKEGNHSLGRSKQASIRIKAASISKVHGKMMVTEDKVILSDNQSSNGVIVNGVKIQNKVLAPGDKFALGEVLFDLIQLPNYVSILPDQPVSVPSAPMVTHGNTALAPQELSMVQAQDEGLQVLSNAPKTEENSPVPMNLQEKVEHYIETVALPGIYEFSSKFDLKYVVMAFVIFFILLVTSLSVIPVIKVSRDFVMDESMRRADSLAKLLVQENRSFVINNNDLSINVRSVKNEPGVDQAFIVDGRDGHIIAPIKQKGRYAPIPFIQKARKKAQPYREILDNKIGVSRPILSINPQTGEPTPSAHAIVLYNPDRVAMNIPRILSLMIQILMITIIAGGLLYFFLYKVITKPLYDLNEEINGALKTGTNNIELKTPTPIFQKLVSNMNSALSRMGEQETDSINVGMGDKSLEASEMVHMFPIAALALSPEDELIIAHNDFIAGHPLFEDEPIKDRPLDDLTDSSLVDTIKDLLQKSRDNPNQKHSNSLPSSNGIQFEVSLKSIQEMDTVSYYLVCFMETYEDEEE